MKVLQFFRICSIFQHVFEESVQNFQNIPKIIKNYRFSIESPLWQILRKIPENFLKISWKWRQFFRFAKNGVLPPDPLFTQFCKAPGISRADLFLCSNLPQLRLLGHLMSRDGASDTSDRVWVHWVYMLFLWPRTDRRGILPVPGPQIKVMCEIFVRKKILS